MRCGIRRRPVHLSLTPHSDSVGSRPVPRPTSLFPVYRYPFLSPASRPGHSLSPDPDPVPNTGPPGPQP